MSEDQFIEKLKEFCKANRFEYKGRVQLVGTSILIYVLGNSEKLDAWLNENTKSHTFPVEFDTIWGSVVGSYVKF